ncbi:MAG: cyclic nucleotide-binding domain-containing protein [Deltaproteobacteria bacterium]|nr:cyclic nucleotide-binding domain-containing protein [Deltaproteobacteria bacterium]
MYRIIGEESFADGEVIFAEGSLGRDIYRVKTGAVVICKDVGGRSLILEVLRVGEIFGEMAFISDSPRSATARAVGHTVLSVLDRKQLEDEINGLSPELYQLFECLTLRLKKTTDAAAGISLVRREPRVSKTWFVMYEHGDLHLEAYSQNASCGGLFIKTPSPLSRGERFKLNLQLPDDAGPLGLLCEVAWNRKRTDDPEQFPLGMGVKFVEMSQEDHEKLLHALEKPY